MNGNQPMHQTLEQARAKAAWDCVKNARKSLQAGFDQYEALVKRFPALVNHSGLGQAASFLFSKKDGGAEKLLLGHLSGWLLKSEANQNVTCYCPPYDEAYTPVKDEKKALEALIGAIRNNDSRAYIRATREALSFLDYLRRFAAGLNTKPDQQNKEASRAKA